jgi:uracil-DNA glycosylase
VLDEALESAGIPRGSVYLTNAVMHFRFEERGKRPIHEKPDLSHMRACAPLLEGEVAQVDPDVVVCLGATAGRCSPPIPRRSCGCADATASTRHTTRSWRTCASPRRPDSQQA